MASAKRLKVPTAERFAGSHCARDVRKTIDFVNQYSGYKASEPIVELSPSIEPATFFQQFVSTRRPCIFNGLLADGTWETQLWGPTNLKAKAAEEYVKVEVRNSDCGRFGLGNEVSMKFGEFVQQWQDGNESLYMTTQDLDADEEGRPYLTAAPVTQLVGSFPWRPALAGQLLPQTINLWMGCSRR